MKSSQGPWALLSREILETHIEPNQDEITELGIKWDRSRARDHFNVGSVLYVLHKYPILTNVPGGAIIQKFLQGLGGKQGNVGPPSEEFGRMVSDAFQIFFVICKDSKMSKCVTTPYKYKGPGAEDEDEAKSARRAKLSRGKIAPIEFVMINVLIFVYKSRYSLKELADAIQHLRKCVREEFLDIRSNQKVAKFCLDIIQSLEMNGILVPGNKRSLTAEASISNPGQGTQKRKRGSDARRNIDDEAEEEEVEKEVIKRSKSAKLPKDSKSMHAPPTSTSVMAAATGGDAHMRDAGGPGVYDDRARSSSSSTMVNPPSTPVPGVVRVKQQPVSPPLNSPIRGARDNANAAQPVSSAQAPPPPPVWNGAPGYPPSTIPSVRQPPHPMNAEPSTNPTPLAARIAPAGQTRQAYPPPPPPASANLPRKPSFSSGPPQAGNRAVNMSGVQAASQQPPPLSGANAQPITVARERFSELNALRAKLSSGECNIYIYI